VIYLDRSFLRVPRELSADRAARELDRAAAYFEATSKSARQTRFKFEKRPWDEAGVREALLSLSSGKCAYCETLLDPKEVLVDHFRPRMDTVDLEGNYFPAHYWWLALEWRNLYPTCPECSRSKRSVFPIDGSRAPLRTAYEELASEGALLLDPCRDDPEEHLIYDQRGGVVSTTERGRLTIELLALNRSELVDGRRRARLRFQELLRRLHEGEAELRTELLELGRPETELCGMHRQLLAEADLVPRDVADLPRRTADLLEPEGSPAATWQTALLRARSRVGDTDTEDVATAFDAYKQGLEEYTLASDEPTAARSDAFILLDQTVERLEVENVRIFDRLDVDVSASHSDTAPWLMILGENGCGKSTLLQALAMTLVGDEVRQALELETESYVRWNTPESWIRVRLTGLSQPLELQLRADGTTSGTAIEPKVPILAYGSTRFLPTAESVETATSTYARVENLFHHFAPLTDANAWLLELDEDAFDGAARTLKEILALPDEAVLEPNRDTGRIEIPWLGARSLDELSDGYQSVVAMAVDVMKVMSAHFPAMEAAKGIVLIDEIGAHLHPRWQMRIVSRLRAAFPNVQFIATTHNPLCLRGLRDGEVVVLHRAPHGRVFAVTDLPSITGLRVDQLLTSEHFGLASTIDPEIERDMIRYQRLLLETRPGPEEKEELARLEETLAQHQMLGSTQRERIMLEAIDRHFGKVAEAGSQDEGRRLRSELDAKLRSIMAGEGERS
jgi:uncharacterized protein (TIGR02646 family)